MILKFLDEEHENFYSDMVLRTHSEEDVYRKAFFYALGLTDETRRHIDSLYGFTGKCINFTGFSAAWQTGTSIKVTRLAFNLFNGFTGEDVKDTNANHYSPEDLFACNLAKYMFEAVKLRYPDYCR